MSGDFRKFDASENTYVPDVIQSETSEGSENTVSLNERSLHTARSATASTSQRSDGRPPANEIEAMNRLMRQVQQESAKRTQMLSLIFDKNFEERIRNCMQTRKDMEARAAAFEALIQQETLIKKPIKEITIQENHDEDNNGEFLINFSRTGSTSEEPITTPPDQAPSPSDRPGTNASPAAFAEAISPKKLSIEPNSVEHAESADKKTSKKLRGARLAKFGHWSKNAFNFFRAKNAISGKDGQISRKTSEKTSRQESSDHSEHTPSNKSQEAREAQQQARQARKKSRSTRTPQPKPSKLKGRKITKKGPTSKVGPKEAKISRKEDRKQATASSVLKYRAAKLSQAKNKLWKRNETKKATIPAKQRKLKSSQPKKRKSIKALAAGTPASKASKAGSKRNAEKKQKLRK
ncbi:unnamed protein product [Gongylonema pulchrum]|uniref:Uncharacterized protein n=1 Tax=Gongylonema pulchrum TaxID=637853 RepID=A0A183DVM7_9BILA|nr:unnamed protein product [Gongylonema pulchrum]